MAVIFIFIDGIGIGSNQSENPLANKFLKSFSAYTGENGFHKECNIVENSTLLYKGIDANLDVVGLPQSGTGQVSLFSGLNASKKIGRHFGPYPHSETRYMLEKHSLFHGVLAQNKSPHFINAYPDIFFERGLKKDRWSATTLMAKSAGQKLNTEDDVRSGIAVTAEIKQNIWRDLLGINLPEITEQEAAQRVLNAAAKHHLVLYEFYLTDKAGHSMSRSQAESTLSLIDPFLNYLFLNISEKDTLVITSDHGNLEDLTRKTHTRNPVPLFVKGNTTHFKKAESILDITPAVLGTLKGGF